MKHFDAVKIIERTKLALKIEHDQELARVLGTSRTTLASWKKRGSIPAKYLSEIMMYASGISFDWLLTGTGTMYRTAEDHFESVNQHVDIEVFWLAILSWHIDLAISRDKTNHQLHELLTTAKLQETLISLTSDYAQILASKKKWEKSDLVSKKDIYKAIATERGLSEYETPPNKWWDE